MISATHQPIFTPTPLVAMRMVSPHWWCTSKDVYEDDLIVTTIDLKSWLKLRGRFACECSEYTIVCEWRTASLVLQRDAEPVCRASKRLLRRSFELQYGQDTWAFEPRSRFDSTFVLTRGGVDAGWVAPRGFLQNHLAGRLSKQLPFPVRVFLMWLVLSTVGNG